ncbi:tetratricopeptide repeat protein [Thermococcus sp.]
MGMAKNIGNYLSRVESLLKSNSKQAILESVRELENVLRVTKNENNITKKKIADEVSLFLFNLIAEEPTQIGILSREYLELVELCLELDPDNIFAGFAKLAYLSAVDPEKAKKWAFSLGKLIYGLENTPQKALYLGVLATRLVSLGLFTDAVVLCKEAISVCSGLNNEKEKLRAISKYIETLADAQIKMNNDELIRVGKKLAQKYRGYLGMRFYRTYSYYLLRVESDSDKAWRFLEKAEMLFKGDSQLEEVEFSYVLYTKSLIYMKKGLLDESITALKMALEILEKNGWKHRPLVSNLTLGVISMLTGNYSVAEQYFGKYVASKGIYVTPLDNMLYYLYISMLSILEHDYEAFNKNVTLLKEYYNMVLGNQMEQMNLHIHNKVHLLLEISEYVSGKKTLIDLCRSVHFEISNMLHKKVRIDGRPDIHNVLRYIGDRLLYPLSNGDHDEFLKNTEICKKELLSKLKDVKESEKIKKKTLEHVIAILDEILKNPQDPSNILSMIVIATIMT